MICDNKFGSCQKSFSWFGQKVNKKIDVYGTMLTPHQDISTWFRILIEFEATEYSYSIRIKNFEDIRFDIQFE